MCPIGHTIMVDPVIASDGHTYERRNIEKWLKIKRTSPLTNKDLEKKLTPNTALEVKIQQKKEEDSILKKEYDEAKKNMKKRQ